ncbi:hypothetical protein N9R54_04735 [Pelobium sp.]|nr:hypothetical protein [Pelobium sp.]MDA9555522.1 hypothetical protein [Pelobium sp.]
MKIITLLFLLVTPTAISSCKNKTQKVESFTFVNDTLSYELAKKYVKNYEKHAGFVDSLYSDSLNRLEAAKLPDTRTIWFSIEKLESLVSKIKSEGGDGIRFYLAAYDTYYPKDFKKGYIPPKDNWGYNTLIMVSTKDSLNQFHKDYYTNTLVNGQKGKGIILGLGTEPENRGEICPPPADCIGIGATLIGGN